MTNRQLIKILLDEPMDAEVMLDYPKKHFDKNGEVLGYMFEIAAVGRFAGKTIIEFIDWRDKEVALGETQGEWIPIEKGDVLIDHYWYLIAHEDYKTPIKAQYHTDVPHFTFSANGKGHISYIFGGKITHYMVLPKLPKETEK